MKKLAGLGGSSQSTQFKDWPSMEARPFSLSTQGRWISGGLFRLIRGKRKGRGLVRAMSSWNINLEKKTATSINGVTFKLTEVEPDEFQWICANPKDIPPDDIDDEILGKMAREADAMYRWKLFKRRE